MSEHWSKLINIKNLYIQQILSKQIYLPMLYNLTAEAANVNKKYNN